MHALERKSLEFINETGIIKSKESVLVAVSGGADSVALLYFFVSTLAPLLNLKIAAAHLNHCLRGKDSDRDSSFVKSLCKRLNIAIYSKKHVMKKKGNESPEEVARRIRYSFLEKTADKYGFGKIATAHHQDDQAETVLMRLLSGTGFSGISGIRPQNRNVVRPFLAISRNEILDYLKIKRQVFRLDKSNLDTNFLRNKIRIKIIPYLKKNFNSHVTEALSRFGLQTGRDMDIPEHKIKILLSSLVQREAKDSMEFDLDILSAYPAFLIKAVLEAAIKKIGHPAKLTSNHINSFIRNVINGKNGGAIQFPGPIYAERSYNNLVLGSKIKTVAIYPEALFSKLPGIYPTSDKGLNIKIEVKENIGKMNFPKDTDTQVCLDYDALASVLSLRTRKKGDTFHPLGSPGEMKLKDFLINRKVPKMERDNIGIICSGNTIVWVVGHRISERFKIRPETRKIALIALVK